MLGLAQMRIDNEKDVTGFAIIHVAGILHAVRNFRIAHDLNEQSYDLRNEPREVSKRQVKRRKDEATGVSRKLSKARRRHSRQQSDEAAGHHSKYKNIYDHVPKDKSKCAPA